MINISEYKTYWQNAAIRNNAIGHVEGVEKHFSVFTPEEALASIKQMKYPYLAVELPEIRINDSNSDNVRMLYNGGVLILDKAPQGDYVKIQAAFQNTFIIAYQLLTKLYNDRKKANDIGASSPESFLKHLDLQSISLLEVGPVFDGCFGWRINHQFNSPANLDLVESEWTGETKWNFYNS